LRASRNLHTLVADAARSIFQTSAAVLKERIAGVFDARAFEPKVPDDFFVIEKHVAVVVSDADIAFRVTPSVPNNRPPAIQARLMSIRAASVRAQTGNGRK
jgi:hypothetical protein